jgi:hypothetical protein
LTIATSVSVSAQRHHGQRREEVSPLAPQARSVTRLSLAAPMSWTARGASCPWQFDSGR